MKLNMDKGIHLCVTALPAILFVALAVTGVTAQVQQGITRAQVPEAPATSASNTSSPTNAADAKKDETEEVRQLRERLQLLERTVEELKGQINSIAANQKSPSGGAAATTSSVAVATSPGDKVASPVPGTGIGLEPDAPPPTATPKQDKSGNTFEVYGFVMVDAGYQFGQNDPAWFDVIRATKLPSFENEYGRDGHTYFGVRQTRFGVKSSTPTKWGDLKTQFEFELFGTGVDAGQTTFRLRHAYGELGQFGAGQTWSPFMDIDSFPNTVEYWGPTGMPFFRNVQVRWMPIKGQSRVTIALERPGASGDAGVVADRIELEGIRPKFAWPDLSWEARYGKNWGYVEIAGILRSIKWVDTNDDKLDLGGSDLGWGLNLTSNLNFTKKDVARLGAVYGEGIQNYMNDSPVDVGAEFDLSDPLRPIKGRALPIFAMTAFLDHTWNEKFTSSVGYSFQNIENSSAQLDSAFHRGHYAIGNLLFYPVKNAMVGAELQWGRRENYRDNFTSDDLRIQFSFKYNFNKLFEW